MAMQTQKSIRRWLRRRKYRQLEWERRGPNRYVASAPEIEGMYWQNVEFRVINPEGPEWWAIWLSGVVETTVGIGYRSKAAAMAACQRYFKRELKKSKSRRTEIKKAATIHVMVTRYETADGAPTCGSPVPVYELPQCIFCSRAFGAKPRCIVGSEVNVDPPMLGIAQTEQGVWRLVPAEWCPLWGVNADKPDPTVKPPDYQAIDEGWPSA